VIYRETRFWTFDYRIESRAAWPDRGPERCLSGEGYSREFADAITVTGYTRSVKARHDESPLV
jgi:hypothetical protein